MLKIGDDEIAYNSLTQTNLKEYDSPVFNKKGSISINQADHSTGKVIDSMSKNRSRTSQNKYRNKANSVV